jgi:hypothetical protein
MSRPLVGVGLVLIALVLGAAAILVATSPPDALIDPSASPGTTPSAAPTSAAGDVTAVTFRDFTVLPGEPPEPVGASFQSRLWSVDGRWWSAMVDPATRETRAFALDDDGVTWSDRGVLLDERPGAMVDTLWTGDHLIVATAVPGRSTRNGVRVLRFSSTDDGSFRLDPNFPVTLTARGVAGVSVARDGAGRLWLATVQDQVVSVAHSTVDDAIWSGPTALPGASRVGPDDGAAVVDDGTGAVVLAWTDSAAGAIRVADHETDAPPESWGPPQVALDGLPITAGALTMAALDGTIVLGGRTAVAVSPEAGPTDPDGVIVVRDPGTAWRSALFSRVEDRLGTPLVVVDRGTRDVYGFATTPRNGGAVMVKRAELDRLEFPSGRGSAVMLDPSDPEIAFLSTTKTSQRLQDGLVLSGFDQETGSYWHALLGPPDGVPWAAAGSPGPDTSSPPVDPPATTVLFTDDFDAWPTGDAIAAGWTLEPAGVEGTLVSAADPSGAGHHARLRPAGGAAVRACKPFPPTTAGRLAVSVDVWLDGIADADAIITSVRDGGDEAASVRFGQGGTLAYYAGQTKVRTEIANRTDQWYRSTVTVDLEERTYAWRLEDADGGRVLAVDGIPFRDAAAGGVSELCVATSTQDGLRFDAVSVSR